MSFHIKEVQAERTEIPRSFSTWRESVMALPVSTDPIFRVAPPKKSRFSVIVVLPASTWASTAILRMFCIFFKLDSEINSGYEYNNSS